ncbi:UNVERIFIED_CONTAM: hypothetical protein K2H54_059697 [Gekko kuhli]
MEVTDTQPPPVLPPFLSKSRAARAPRGHWFDPKPFAPYSQIVARKEKKNQKYGKQNQELLGAMMPVLPPTGTMPGQQLHVLLITVQ